MYSKQCVIDLIEDNQIFNALIHLQLEGNGHERHTAQKLQKEYEQSVEYYYQGDMNVSLLKEERNRVVSEILTLIGEDED